MTNYRVFEYPSFAQVGDLIVVKVPVFPGERLLAPPGWHYTHTHIENGQRYDTYTHTRTATDIFAVGFAVTEEEESRG